MNRLEDECAMLALFCYKKDDCSDKPIIVIVGRTGMTHAVINDPDVNTHDDLNIYDHFRFNGIPKYDITISENEYNERFGRMK